MLVVGVIACAQPADREEEILCKWQKHGHSIYNIELIFQFNGGHAFQWQKEPFAA